MRKRLFAVIAVAALALGIIAAGAGYYDFVSKTIFDESAAHLTEIYHQANQSLHSLVGRNWNAMHMWVPYLRDTRDEAKVEEFVRSAREENGFTDFFFISREGEYLTISDDRGYLDLKNSLPQLIIRREDTVVSSVVPGKPEIMVFAVPAEPGTFHGFDYEAIAITFNNSNLVESLKISAFNGQSGSYVIHPDGRVIVDASTDQTRKIYNFVAALRDYSDCTEEEIAALQADFTGGRSGVSQISLEGEDCYLVYEPVEFEDWVVIGLVPTRAVNASMNTLQYSTLLLVGGVVSALAVALVVILILRYRRSLAQKESEIQYREELFSVLTRNVDDVFIMLDENFRVNYISPNVEALVGIPESVARENIRVVDGLVRDEETVLVLDELPGIPPGGQAMWDREYVHQKTGETRWFRVSALCRELQGGKKYILVLSDRTKEKKANQALEDAVGLARSANQAKSTFLSNMSHDIRTPMNAIIGFATLAAANVTDTEKVKDYLGKILSSGNHLLSLINDVLDMSRIESGKIHLEEQAVSLSDVFHDIKTIISGQIHAKQLELYMDTMDVTNEDVYCDKTRLNQVLLNLLSNAIKFTPPGGTVSVRMVQLPGAPEGSGLYELRVKDTGIGMSPEFAQRIFEPFERERTSTVSKIQGTGLGMAISKNIIDMMGGTIEVRTERGRGTEFIIRLTLRLQSERRSVERIRELEGLKALVVDDDFNTCDSVTKMLVQVGMRSEWTMTGREAVLRARQSLELGDPFHAYIIDWRLPDVNGIEVTRQIRALGDDTPIIILTAYDWSEIEAEARAAGVTAFCSKPMFMSDLRESLLSALGRKENGDGDASAAIGNSGEFKGRRLLLVEDNELNREIALEILSGYGFEIETAENGRKAVDKVKASRANPYDLVMMDIQMPIMDGCEATRRIRALEDPALASLPIIAMTANAFDEDRREAEACGMNGFLSKPIDIGELVLTLQKTLE